MPKKLTTSKTSHLPNSDSQSHKHPPSHIPTTFTDGLPLPSLFAWDLDFTLWPFWVDTHVTPPIKPTSKDPSTNYAMLDRHGESFTFYHEVPGILHAAHAQEITMALASRTCTPDLAEKMLRGIVIPVPPKLHSDLDAATSEDAPKRAEKPSKAWDLFTYREIFPGSKIKHFKNIQRSTAKKGEEIPFTDMIFFDDEGRNREVETQLGVTFVLVRDGVTRELVDYGVREWRRRRGLDTGKGGKDLDEKAEAEV